MHNLNIGYSLTPCEVIQFPFISPYGLRHLDRGDWLNRTIGAIEVVPVLGLVASLIELVIKNVLESIDSNTRLRAVDSTLTNKIIGVIEVFPLLGPIVLKIDEVIQEMLLEPPVLPLTDPEKWKTEFKAKVLCKKVESPIDLSLSFEQEKLLKNVISDLENKDRSDKAIVHGKNGVWVFSVIEIPGLIFKVEMERTKVGNDFKKRIDATNKAKELIEKESLNLLHVPAQKLIELKSGNKSIEVLIEQSFDILHGTRYQEILFKNCLNDPELKEFIQECARQLIVLVVKLGYKDVRYDNNPLLSNGAGMALVDMDISDDPYTGLRCGRTKGEDGILQYLSSEMLESFVPYLIKELTEEQFNQLDIEELKAMLIANEKRDRLFTKYLEDRHITDAKTPVKLAGFLPTDYNNVCARWSKKINEQVSYNLGIHLTTERKFYLKDTPFVDELNRLKKEGKIFEWKDAKEMGSSGGGFFIWC